MTKATTSSAGKVARIYALIDPATSNVRYCGLTTMSLRDRLRWHFANTTLKAKPSPVCSWVDALIDNQMVPLIRLLEECSFKDRHDREKYWISRLRAEGAPLLNISSGGSGASFVRNEDTCRAISEAVRDSWRDDNVRANRVAGLREAAKRPEVIEKRRSANRASAARRSETLKTRNQDEGFREANRQAQISSWAKPEKRVSRLAAIKSPESREANSRAQKRRHQDPEKKQRFLAQRQDPEYRKRLSEAMTAWHAARKAAGAQT